MDFHPTSFFILENAQLGTFWVGQAKMRMGAKWSITPPIHNQKSISRQTRR